MDYELMLYAALGVIAVLIFFLGKKINEAHKLREENQHRDNDSQILSRKLFYIAENQQKEKEQNISEKFELQTRLAASLRSENQQRTEKGRLQKQLDVLQADYDKHKLGLQKVLESNVATFPWLAGIMADYLTYDTEILAKSLEWGHSVERAKKVASIREIRKAAQEQIAQAKVATYQLEYLLQLYPGLEDVLATDYKDLDFASKISDHDYTRDYLSK